MPLRVPTTHCHVATISCACATTLAPKHEQGASSVDRHLAVVNVSSAHRRDVSVLLGVGRLVGKTTITTTAKLRQIDESKTNITTKNNIHNNDNNINSDNNTYK